MRSESGSIWRWSGLLAMLLSGPVGAHELSANECREGAEFIEHAAMSRDNGITREAFMLRMQEDIAAIQAFPPALRWFVQDSADEELLLSAAQQVFDEPRTPQDHRSNFDLACAERVSAKGDSGAQANE